MVGKLLCNFLLPCGHLVECLDFQGKVIHTSTFDFSFWERLSDKEKVCRCFSWLLLLPVLVFEQTERRLFYKQTVLVYLPRLGFFWRVWKENAISQSTYRSAWSSLSLVANWNNQINLFISRIYWYLNVTGIFCFHSLCVLCLTWFMGSCFGST